MDNIEKLTLSDVLEVYNNRVTELKRSKGIDPMFPQIKFNI